MIRQSLWNSTKCFHQGSISPTIWCKMHWCKKFVPISFINKSLPVHTTKSQTQLLLCAPYASKLSIMLLAQKLLINDGEIDHRWVHTWAQGRGRERGLKATPLLKNYLKPYPYHNFWPCWFMYGWVRNPVHWLWITKNQNCSYACVAKFCFILFFGSPINKCWELLF